MSDDFLLYVPTPPRWQPTPEIAERAAIVARALFPDAYEIEARVHDEVTVIHPGVNWEGVTCPSCGWDLEKEAWWNKAMAAAHKTGFADLDVTTPCCGARSSLADLAYPRPVRFGRFVLEIMNPGVGQTCADQDAKIAEALGSPVGTVWMHL